MDYDDYADAGYDTKRTENRRARNRAETRHAPDRDGSAHDDSAPDRRTDGGRARRTGDERDERSRPSTADRKTMGDVSHTNPYTGESFGNTVAYRRGSVVVVDGGEADAVSVQNDESGKTAAKAETMGDISHEPPHDAPDPNAVYMRGGEGDDDVEE